MKKRKIKNCGEFYLRVFKADEFNFGCFVVVVVVVVIYLAICLQNRHYRK